MSASTNPASVTPAPLFEELGTGKLRVLRNDVTVHDPARGRTWTIPAGIVFDGPSVPRLCCSLIAQDDIGDVPALPHDVLYGARGAVPTDESIRYTRGEADALFLDLMIAAGAEPWVRAVAYEAVRLRGASHWSAAA